MHDKFVRAPPFLLKIEAVFIAKSFYARFPFLTYFRT